jgi:formiminotetrahydrofolate cyclodeaminase
VAIIRLSLARFCEQGIHPLSEGGLMAMSTANRGSAGTFAGNENISAFLRVLDPTDDLTGGGTASAVAGAMAAGLVAMVARLSIGKKGMKDEAYYRAIDGEAQTLSVNLFAGGREDSEAFRTVRAAYRQAAAGAESGSSRGEQIQKAVIQAARVPLENAEACKRVLDLCVRLEGHSNPNAESDLECACHLARAGLLGCLANVEINLGSLEDEERCRRWGERVRALRKYVQQRGDHTNT